MSNLTTNRLDAALSAEDLAALSDLVQQMYAKLPFLVALTPDERKRLRSVHRQNRLFVEDTLAVFAEVEGLMPGYVSEEAMRKDFALHEALSDVEVQLEGLLALVRSTRMLAGAEALSMALATYQFVKVAADAGLPGAAPVRARLSARFAGQGRQEPEPEAPEADSDADAAG
jgi:hypothetical protein